MNLTKRHKVFLAVFLVGLVALVADRTILRPEGGPRAASANPAETYTVAQNLPFQASGEGLGFGNQPQGTPLAERLASLVTREEAVSTAQEAQNGITGLRNPFLLPPSWLSASGAVDAPVPDIVARFVRMHHLAGVVKNGRECRALVDDQFLVVGQVLNGFTLVAIGDRSAVFERDGLQAVLELLNR